MIIAVLNQMIANSQKESRKTNFCGFLTLPWFFTLFILSFYRLLGALFFRNSQGFSLEYSTMVLSEKEIEVLRDESPINADGMHLFDYYDIETTLSVIEKQEAKQVWRSSGESVIGSIGCTSISWWNAFRFILCLQCSAGMFCFICCIVLNIISMKTMLINPLFLCY